MASASIRTFLAWCLITAFPPNRAKPTAGLDCTGAPTPSALWVGACGPPARALVVARPFISPYHCPRHEATDGKATWRPDPRVGRRRRGRGSRCLSTNPPADAVEPGYRGIPGPAPPALQQDRTQFLARGPGSAHQYFRSGIL